MIRVEIDPVWRFRREDNDQSMLVMLDFLNEIRVTGTLSQAAARAQMSYRHCWNMVIRWSDFFGAPLVERSRGRGTRLTELGEKLVWAGERMRARLLPQLQNLAQELETELRTALPQRAPLIRIHASHGFAVSKLREMLDREPELGVDLRYVSNQNSLAALAHGGCELAGIHLPQGPLRRKAVAAVRPWLIPGDHRIVGFVTREMGMIVARGNPRRITRLQALAQPGVRFVNREPESGTRQLFERLLAASKLGHESIDGFERVEFTHAAVAAYVASGMADAAFGVEAAARQFDLDFVRLATEDYYLVCRREVLEMSAMQRVLDILRGEEFHTAIAGLSGYSAAEAGVIKTVGAIMRGD